MAFCATLVACTSEPVVPQPTPAPQPQAQEQIDDPARPINLAVYSIVMPLGAISNNSDFWKQLDSNVVDQHTFDSLYENGFRIGEGRLVDWTRLKPYLERDNSVFVSLGPHVSLSSFNPVLLELSPEPILKETLWLWDEHGNEGRDYYNCKNILAISLQWAPREMKTVRMSICPSVQTIPDRSKFDPDFDPSTPRPLIQPKGLYDLHLRLDLPAGQFLVIAPSKLAGDPDRIGHRFLVAGTAADQLEHVLIFTAGEVALPQRRFAIPTTVPTGQAVPLDAIN